MTDPAGGGGGASDGPKEEDPLRALQQAYDQALTGWTQALQETLGHERFAAAAGGMLTQFVEMQEMARTASAAAAQSLHLPTADDLARVGQLVINVERKVDELVETARTLEERLASIEARLERPAPPAPRRRRASASGGG